MLSDVLVFAIPLVLSATLLAALHWFPWYGELDRLTAYTIGTVVVVGVPVVTMILIHMLGLHYPESFWAPLLVSNAVVSGLTVKFAYWYDSRRPISHQDIHDAKGRD